MFVKSRIFIAILSLRASPKSESFIKGKSLRSSNKIRREGLNKNKKMAAFGAPPRRGFFRWTGDQLMGAWSYRENIGVALGVGALALGTWYGCSKGKEWVDGYADRNNPLTAYDNFSLPETYKGGKMFIKKVDGILEVKYTKGKRIIEVNDDDGNEEVDALWYTPKGGERTLINRGATDSKLVDIVTKGDEVLDAAYQIAREKGKLETIAD